MADAEDDNIEAEQRYRASASALLAALFRASPDQELLDYVQKLSPEGDGREDELFAAMSSLAKAAEVADPGPLEDEFNALFIGLGRGEVVPYGSWYLTGFLMEQPLSDLRDDLRRLGFERNQDFSESEDHVSALFEVFSGMILNGFDPSEQRRFFETHLYPWVGQFFEDLGKARSAEFYLSVARFGAAYVSLESAYLSINV